MTNFRLIACLLVVIPLWTLAQTNDFQTRSGIQLKQDLPKGFDLSLTYQLRMDHNSQAFSGSYISVDAGYKIGKHLSAVGEFRYATSYSWDKFRFGVGLVADKKVEKIQLSAKLRYQHEEFYQSIPEIGQNPARNNIRLKLQAERKVIKHVQGHISSEPQVRIVALQGGFQRVRNIVGLDWEFSKHQHFDLAYYYQPEFKNSRLVNTNHMVVGTYAIELGKWWKKKNSKEEEPVENGTDLD